jgi:uncharacterized protein (DUF2236 family)
MVHSDTLTVTPTARTLAHRLLDGSDVWFPIPASYKALTARMIPPVLRDAFGLPFDEAEQRTAGRLVFWLKRVHPLLPTRLRYVGPYQEAAGRLAGKLRPDHLTRLANRFWIGRPSVSLDPGSANAEE